MNAKFDGVGLPLGSASVEITPQWAAEILALQEHNGWVNRKLYPGKVKQYKEAMISGTFEPNTLIQLSPRKRLLDAWHRLTACVAADVPFYAIVVTDVPERVHPKIDIGAKRTIAHHLTFEGKVSPQLAAAAVTLANTLDMYVEQARGRTGVAAGPALSRTNGVDLDRARALIEQHPKLVDSIGYVGTKSQTMSAAIMGTVHYLMAHVAGKPAEANTFIDQLKSGSYLAPNSPILALRRVFLEKKPVAVTDFGTRLWLTVEAANCFLLGESVSKGIFSKRLIESIGPAAVMGATPADVHNLQTNTLIKAPKKKSALALV